MSDVIQPKFIAVRLEETLEHWSEGIKGKVARIFSHYLYNENSVTHCCEITPSYDLRWVGFDIDFGDRDLTEEDIDALEEIIRDGYSSPDNDGYYHCRIIDKIPLGPLTREVFMEGDDLKPWAEGYGSDNVFKEVMDAYFENPVFS